MHDNRDSNRRYDRSGHQPWPSDSHAASSAQPGNELTAEEHITATSVVGAEARGTDTKAAAKEEEVPVETQVEEGNVVTPAVGGTPSDVVTPSDEITAADVVQPAEHTIPAETDRKSDVPDADTDPPAGDRSTVADKTAASESAAESGAAKSLSLIHI